MMLLRLLYIFTASLLIPAGLLAQAEARQARPEDSGGEILQEIPDPMLLEVSLGAKGESGKPLSDPGVKGRTYYDTKGFVCDKARVPKILVMKRPNKKGGIDLEITPTLATGWPRQDIDLTVALVRGDQTIQKKVWDDLTIGADDSTANKLTALSPIAGFAGSSTKRPAAVFSFGPGEFEKLFDDGEAPKLRLIVDIQ